MKCKVFCSCYKNYKESLMGERARACGFDRYTKMREIEYEKIEDIPDIYLDKYGDDLEVLRNKYSYLFAIIDNRVIRLTD